MVTKHFVVITRLECLVSHGLGGEQSEILLVQNTVFTPRDSHCIHVLPLELCILMLYYTSCPGDHFDALTSSREVFFRFYIFIFMLYNFMF